VAHIRPVRQRRRLPSGARGGRGGTLAELDAELAERREFGVIRGPLAGRPAASVGVVVVGRCDRDACPLRP